MTALAATRLCLFLLILACAVLVAYPYVLYPQILKLLPKRRVERTGTRPGSVTLLFCAFNEEGVVGDKLANIEQLKARHPDLEVLAYDDGSTDQTPMLLGSRPDLVTLVQGAGRSGKAHGMKRLAGLASGEVLVFTDANVLLREDAIANLLGWYADPEVGGVCGSLHYINADESVTASVGGFYWRLEEKLKSLESLTGSVMGADGSIFSIRRALYPHFPDTVLDDLTVSMAAVFAHKRLIKVEDVAAFERLAATRSDEFSRKVRISARAYHTHRYLRPQLKKMSALDRFKYRSRKVIRWFGGFYLLSGAVAAVALAFTFSLWFGLVLLASLLVGAVFVTRARRGTIAAAGEIIIALIATLVGVARAARGHTFVTWSPPKSR